MKSARYVMPRLSLAYLSVFSYLRTFWWFAAVIPVFGVFMLFQTSGLMRLIGLMALLWPITLPARAILASGKAARLFLSGAYAELHDEEIRFIGEDGRGMRLRLESIRDEWITPRYWVLQVRTGGVVPIERAALGAEEERWRHAVRDGIRRWREA